MTTKPSVVVITGATAGIGAACARRFAAEGTRLVLLGRRADRLEALAKELTGRGAHAHAVMLDVQDRRAVKDAFASLPKDFTEVDVLVNNAGLARGMAKAQEASLDDWDVMVDTNVKGLLYVTAAVLPGMVARGRGHVVNLGSVAGTYPYPGGNVYGATKAFVEQLSLGMRADLLGTPVRVTNIEPGMVETEFTEVRMGGDRERAAAVYKGMRPLRPEDVADVVFFCATCPPHLNVNRIEIMPVDQAFSPFSVHRAPG